MSCVVALVGMRVFGWDERFSVVGTVGFPKEEEISSTKTDGCEGSFREREKMRGKIEATGRAL